MLQQITNFLKSKGFETHSDECYVHGVLKNEKNYVLQVIVRSSSLHLSKPVKYTASAQMSVDEMRSDLFYLYALRSIKDLEFLIYQNENVKSLFKKVYE
jgi:CO dehydrogenase/acetyl-CoA synthase epsilon subunit